MFFPYTNFKVVDVPQTNANGQILYTTSKRSIIWFMPRGANMESDSPVGIYIEQHFIDTDGQISDPFIFFIHDAKPRTDTQSSSSHDHQLNTPGFLNAVSQQHGTYLNIPSIVDGGKNIRAYIADSSDRFGGTLYVFELPE